MPTRSSQSLRRCPKCGTVGRLYKSHARNKIERIIDSVTSGSITKYRCHQCNWRGYMFKKFQQQTRTQYYLTLLGFFLAAVAAVFIIPQILIRFVAVFAK